MSLIARSRVGRVGDTGASQVVHYFVESSTAPAPGSFVVLVSGEIELVPDAGELILGLVTSKKEQKAGYGMADGVTQVQARDATIGVQIANDNTVFAMPVSEDGTTQGLPAAANVGNAYGIVVIGGEYFVDLSNTTELALLVVDIDILTGTAFCLVIRGVRQQG